MKELDEKIMSWKFSCLNLAKETVLTQCDDDFGPEIIIDAGKKYYNFITEGLELSKPNDEPPF